MGRAFSTSYLAGDRTACALIPVDFRAPADRVARARLAARRRISPALATVLGEQQARLPPSPARQANLDALVAGNAAVVVSGQQVGLFLGPLYTFYKAASAIAIARAIEAESGVRTVPLFWLQTEDHDFAEIAACTVADPDGAALRLTLQDGAADDARASVAHRVLGPEVAGLCDALVGGIGDGPGAAEVVALLRAHYVPGRPLAQAFAGALAAIFADEGLLFLDPRDARVAAEVAPVYRRAIEDADAIDRALGARAAVLAAAGFDEQIPLRPGSSLVFFHRGSATGPRFRLQRQGGNGAGADGGGGSWTMTGTGLALSRDELLATLRADPLRFSTSALLRPIIEDTLLPTVAYVGGPAEVSYFAQLMPLYEHFDVAPPLVVPRARFRCVDARARRLLTELGLEPDHLARPTDELLARLAVATPAGAPEPAAIKRRVAEEIAPLVERLVRDIEAADPSLARAAARTRASVAHALGRLTDRYARGMLDRDTTTRRRLERLQGALYPGGAPQERVFGWPTLAARLGPAVFKRLVFETLAAAGAFPVDLLELRP